MTANFHGDNFHGTTRLHINKANFKNEPSSKLAMFSIKIKLRNHAIRIYKQRRPVRISLGAKTRENFTSGFVDSGNMNI